MSQQTPENNMHRFQNVKYVSLCNCSRVNNNGKKETNPIQCVPNPGTLRPSKIPDTILPIQNGIMIFVLEILKLLSMVMDYLGDLKANYVNARILINVLH